MVGKLLKGIAVCATLGLATVGALTFVPDESWDTFPPALAPIRAELAKYGVAPAKFRVRPDEEQETPSEPDAEPEAEKRQYAATDFSRRAYASSKDRGTSVRIGGRSANPNYTPDLEEAGRSSAFDVDSYLTSNDSFNPQSGAPSRFTGTSTPEDSSTSEPIAQSSALVGGPAQRNQFDGELYPDEPGVRSSQELDEILTDRSALDPYANENDPYAVSEPNVRADESAFGSNAVLDDSFPSVDVAIPNQNDQYGQYNQYNQSAAPYAQGNVNNAPDAARSTSADAQGYLSADVDYGVAAQDPTPVGAPAVQSYEDYLNSQSLAQSSPPSSNAVLEPEDETAFVPNTHSTINSAVNPPAPAAPSLNELLAAAAQPRSEEQTRAIFTALNEAYRKDGATMNEADRTRLVAALDRLAYEVFYDPTKAVLESPYQTRSGETLAKIARAYDVTPEFLGAINNLPVGVNAPLPTGHLIKVVRGPVTAELSAAKKELLLCFNGYYAGRFKFGVPQNALNLRGQYAIETKIDKPSCDAIDVHGSKMTIPGGAENNPLGACWIGLKGGPGLQGTNRPELVGTIVPENGGFVFSNKEISQLNILLPIGATVTLRD